MGLHIPSLKLAPTCKRLDRLESTRIKPSQNEGVVAALVSARNLIHRAMKDPFTSKKRLKELKVRVLALAYRLGNASQGEERLSTPDERFLKALREKASHWKKRQLCCNGEDLNGKDLERLQEMACYPKLVEFLLGDPLHLSRFFKWSIVNHLSSRVFAEFPALTVKIDRSNLKSRIGAYGGNGLEYKQGDVTLLFQGKPKSILEGGLKIELSNHVALTVDQIFQQFRRKNLDEGYLTYFEDGVANWDPHEMGPLNGYTGKIDRIDLNRTDWHKQLKERRHFTADEATSHFGIACDGKNWIVTIVATRCDRRLDTFGGHAYYRLLIPNGDGTYFYTHGFGKFAKRYPQNGRESKGMLAQPVEATIEYPDNNEIYTQRQKKEFHYSMSEEKGKAFLESVRLDIWNAWQGNLAFQILVDNCTDWVVEKVRKYVGIQESELFDVPFLKLEPRGFLGSIAKILRKAPHWFTNLFFYCFLFFLGGHKKMILTDPENKKRVVSVLKTPPWKKVFHHPGLAWQAAGS